MINRLSFVVPRSGRGKVPVLAFLAIAATIPALVTPLLFRVVIDDAIVNENLVKLLAVTGLLAAVTIFGIVTNYAKVSVATSFGGQVAFDLKTRLFRHLQYQPLFFFQKGSTGARLSSLSNDVNTVQGLVGNVLVPLMQSVLTLLFSLVVAFLLDWRVSLATLPVMMFAFGATVVLQKKSRAVANEMLERHTEVMAFAVPRMTVEGHLNIATYGKEAEESNRFADITKPLIRLGARQARVAVLPIELTSLTALTGMMMALGLGGYFVITDQISLGTLVALSMILGRINAPIASLSTIPVSYASAMVGVDRVSSILRTPSEIQSPPRPTRPNDTGARGSVDFDAVSFSYPDQRPLLQHLSFQIGRGQKVALVGPNGAGKTTVGYLMLRLFDVKEGRVLVDGVDVRQFDLADLRSRIGFVPHRPVFFSNTVLENLSYGNDNASPNEIKKALQIARCDDVIATLPQGLTTYIGEGGFELSAGQQQMLSLARVVVKDSHIILLDEATSSLDSSTDALFHQTLSTLGQDKTVLVIAHRLSTILACDTVMVLDEGRIVATGSHQKLLKSSSNYKNLVKHQIVSDVVGHTDSHEKLVREIL